MFPLPGCLQTDLPPLHSWHAHKQLIAKSRVQPTNRPASPAPSRVQPKSQQTQSDHHSRSRLPGCTQSALASQCTHNLNNSEGLANKALHGVCPVTGVRPMSPASRAQHSVQYYSWEDLRVGAFVQVATAHTKHAFHVCKLLDHC